MEAGEVRTAPLYPPAKVKSTGEDRCRKGDEVVNVEVVAANQSCGGLCTKITKESASPGKAEDFSSLYYSIIQSCDFSRL